MKKGKKKLLSNLLIVMVFVLIPKYSYSIEYGKPLNSKDFDLKGPVVSAIIKDCQFKEEFGEIKKTGSSDTRVYFLSNGHIYKEIVSPTSYKKYEYDNHGYLLSEMVINIGKGKLYKINNESIYDDDTTRIKYNNVYTTDGRIAETKAFRLNNGSSEQIERVVYNYTPGGIKITVYDLYGVQKEITNNGSLRVQRTDTKAFYWEVLTDRLDNKGLIVRRNKTYELSGGKKRNVSNEIRDYDDHGNVIKQTIYLANDNKKPNDILTLKYTYDNFGNWKQKLLFRGNKLLSWEERNITYATDENDYDFFIQDNAKQEELRKKKIDQIKKTIEIEKEKEIAKGPIVSFPDEFACFPGDYPRSASSMGSFERLNAWINANKQESDYSGRVGIEFVVECDGSLSDVRINKSSGGSLDQEAIRLVNKMPKWNPAYKDGKVVRSKIGINIYL